MTFLFHCRFRLFFVFILWLNSNLLEHVLVWTRHIKILAVLESVCLFWIMHIRLHEMSLLSFLQRDLLPLCWYKNLQVQILLNNLQVLYDFFKEQHLIVDSKEYLSYLLINFNGALWTMLGILPHYQIKLLLFKNDGLAMFYQQLFGNDLLLVFHTAELVQTVL